MTSEPVPDLPNNILRIPPHSTESEEALVGILLIDPDRIPRVVNFLGHDDFYNHRTRVIYHAIHILTALGRAVDPVLVLEQLRTMGEAESVTAEYIKSVATSAPNAANAMEHARIIRRKALARDLLFSSEGTARAIVAGEDGDQVLAVAKRRIDTLHAQAEDDGTPRIKIKPRTTSEIMATPRIDEESHFWPGHVAPGALTIFAGWPKAGKTFLLASFIAEMTRGGTWANRAARPARILYLTEESDGTLQPRIEKFQLGEVLWLGPADMPVGMTWSRVAAEVTDFALASQVDLVVVDTVRHWCGLKDENDPSDWSRVMNPLIHLKARGPGVVAIHHTVKDEERRGVNAVSGSNAFTGAGDIVVTLAHADSRDPMNAHRIIERTGRFGQSSTRVRYVEGMEGTPDYYEFLGPAGDAKLATMNERIIRVLAGDGCWFSRADLRGLVRGSADDLDTALARISLPPTPLAQRRKRARGYEYAALGVAPDAPKFDAPGAVDGA